MRAGERPSRGGRRAAGNLLPLLLFIAAGAAAQELNPRAYAPMPTGGNIVMLSYGRSSGGVLFDPSLPVEDVHAVIHASVLLYGHSFGLFGRSANAMVALPYARGEMDGLLAGEYQRVTRSGLADLRGQLTVNLLGGPALAPREFVSHRPTTILGLSLAVAAPNGQYDRAKLITSARTAGRSSPSWVSRGRKGAGISSSTAASGSSGRMATTTPARSASRTRSAPSRPT